LGVTAFALSQGAIAWSALRPPPDPRRGDRALVRRVREGSEDALQRLVERHWHEIVATCESVLRSRADAEDAAQEVVLAVIDKLDSYDDSRPFRPWLHRVALNKARDMRRSRDRAGDSAEMGELEAEREPIFAELEPALARALERLEPQDVQIVVLRHVLRFRSHEISDIVGLPAATVRTRLARAMKRLRRDLESGEEAGA
jgi:RNA polymerase sigma factor (sigma-70 family)